MTPLERITERVNRNGDVDNAATPRPLLTLEEFFEGNMLFLPGFSAFHYGRTRPKHLPLSTAGTVFPAFFAGEHGAWLSTHSLIAPACGPPGRGDWGRDLP
jgi:hypothetical protein